MICCRSSCWLWARWTPSGLSPQRLLFKLFQTTQRCVFHKGPKKDINNINSGYSVPYSCALGVESAVTTSLSSSPEWSNVVNKSRRLTPCLENAAAQSQSRTVAPGRKERPGVTWLLADVVCLGHTLANILLKMFKCITYPLQRLRLY